MQEFVKKLEYYCVYQERCHLEVIQKLFLIKCPLDYHDEILAHLINHDFINEERFAKLFTISKLHQKHWGKVRIENELKQKKINSKIISIALKSIDKEEYTTIFNTFSEKFWHSILEKNKLQKTKKFTDYWLRKGFESDLIFQKVKELTG